ncbi:hypothetical protein DYB37_002856 [Aphanomyces astaci]|uniref:Serine protease n=1 Tax=Aphanomyces astaci TaxID=112090 RepID=A0A3R6WQ38_APHAT|nr:hypothetical protein DYB35_002997 [Aphanomyces astaci]RHZ31609.1 hypothetical protein DYB37_002856 [Aphanomyces astaci]
MRLPPLFLVLASVVASIGRAEDIQSDLSAEIKSTGSAGLAETYNRTIHLGESTSIKLAYPNSRFIYIRFSKLDLPPGDILTLSTNETTVVYKGHGRRRHRPTTSPHDDTSFYSDRLMGDAVEVTYTPDKANKDKKYQSSKNYRSFGISIGSYIRGVARVSSTDGTSLVNPACVSAAPAWRPASCFKESDPQVYKSSRSLARMVMLGSSSSVAQYATGFLVGCSGYFLTNEHNVRTQTQVDATDFGFLAASPTCDDVCNRRSLGCPPKLLLRGSATLVAVDTSLDYALLRFDSHARRQLKRLNVAYLPLRKDKANWTRLTGEHIYVPQHPDGTAAKVAARLKSGHDAVIVDANVTNKCGKRQLGYMADTIGGSSGSPVVASTDHTVLGLHHCGECNAGADGMALRTAICIHDILVDLKKKQVKLPSCFTGDIGQDD